MSLTIKIIQGDAVHALMREPEFLNAWELLATLTPHVTVFQEPPFVTCWYQQYRAAYTPILVLGYSNDNTLSGLLPLAMNITNQALSHAGDQQVEYSGWLCTKEYKQTFISQALATVNRQFTYSKWLWSTIPPHADVTWLTEPGKELKNLYTTFEVIDSPMLDLHNEEKLKKVLKNKSVKSKINRLKRIGELRIERITDSQRVTELIDDIANLVNFRHGAAHGDLAFREDPYQQDFYHARGSNLINNHFSVLWLGEKILAFHFGGIDKNTIYIGLSAFDPTYSKHSPGVIFLIYLANLMNEEGIRYIDLTPGGDEYKERFSNQHHTLYCPTFFNSATSKYQYYCKKHLKKSVLSSLNKLGIDKNKIVRDTNSNHSDSAKKSYIVLKSDITKIQTKSNEHQSINIQKYSDLLLHPEVDDSHKMQPLLSSATQRFSKEETLFSLVENNRLKGIFWMSKPGNKYKSVNIEFTIDDNSVVYNFLDNRETKYANNFYQTLNKMIEVTQSNNVSTAYALLPANISSEDKNRFLKLGFSETTETS